MEELFRQAERAQNDRELRLQNTLEVHERRRSRDFQYLDNRLRTLHGEVQEMKGGIASLKRQADRLEDQGESSRTENREAKRRATEENNVVRGELMNSSRLAEDRHRAMDQRFTDLESASRKVEREFTNLERTVQNAASDFRSAGDRRCMGCHASNLVCVHHVVGSDGVPSSHRRHRGNDSEESESQQTDTSGSNRARAGPNSSERSGRPLGGRTKKRTRPGQ